MSERPSAAVGLIVPPANPTLEVEIHALTGQSPYVYTSRLPWFPGEDLAARNLLYLDSYLDTARRFGNLQLAGILVGCTGSNYRLGPEEDRRRCAATSRELGIPFQTCSLAVLELLQRLGFQRIQLELPYPDWLIAEAEAYWLAAGFEVTVSRSILATLGSSDAYGIEQAEIVDYLTSIAPPPQTVVLLSGTGMLTIAAMGQVVQSFPAPLISSNLCAADWLLRCDPASSHRGTDQYRQLLARLEGFARCSDAAGVDNLFNPF
jgi:maleate isomerase